MSHTHISRVIVGHASCFNVACVKKNISHAQTSLAHISRSNSMRLLHKNRRFRSIWFGTRDNCGRASFFNFVLVLAGSFHGHIVSKCQQR